MGSLRLHQRLKEPPGLERAQHSEKRFGSLTMGLTSWLWWSSGADSRIDSPIRSTTELQEKRDQVLNFLENELEMPEMASRVEEVNACMCVCV